MSYASKEYRAERWKEQGYYVCSCGWEISRYSPNFAEWIDIHSQEHYDEEVTA